MQGGGLFVVVGFVAEDGHGAIELLDEEEADHLVGESHLREAELAVGTLINCFGKAIRSAYNEIEVLRGGHFLLEVGSEVHGAIFSSVFIE